MTLPLQLVRDTDNYLIIEKEYQESLLNLITPTIKIKRVKGVTTRHVQIMRWVFTSAMEQDAYFEGEKLNGAPGFAELLVEKFKPGIQLTRKDTGKCARVLTYIGKKNIIKADIAQSWSAAMKFPFIGYQGKDPVPNTMLIGNPVIVPVQLQDETIFAAAYFDGNNKKLQQIDAANDEKALAHFSQICREQKQ